MDDIRLWREDGKPMCSIECPLRRHSPDGIEWGYGGSGPADLALNIVRDYCKKRFGRLDAPWTVELPDGTRAAMSSPPMSETLYQHFKRGFIENMPKEGGVIKGKDIDTWMDVAIDHMTPVWPEGDAR